MSILWRTSLVVTLWRFVQIYRSIASREEGRDSRVYAQYSTGDERATLLIDSVIRASSRIQIGSIVQSTGQNRTTLTLALGVQSVEFVASWQSTDDTRTTQSVGSAKRRTSAFIEGSRTTLAGACRERAGDASFDTIRRSSTNRRETSTVERKSSQRGGRPTFPSTHRQLL